MNDPPEIVGLWASASGPVLWVRPGRGRSVLVSLAPGRTEPAIDHGSPGREQRTVLATWDGYYYELRIPLPRLPYGAELHLDYDNYSVAAEGDEPKEELTGGVSRDDVPGALETPLPHWFLPREPYRRVPEIEWSEYAIVSSVPADDPSPRRGRRRSGGPQNNQMQRTSGARARAARAARR